jgi:hypothetical protein
MAEWRTGSKLKRTLYRDEVFVGCMDTPELAAEVVEALNGRCPSVSAGRLFLRCSLAPEHSGPHRRAGATWAP